VVNSDSTHPRRNRGLTKSGEFVTEFESSTLMPGRQRIRHRHVPPTVQLCPVDDIANVTSVYFLHGFGTPLGRSGVTARIHNPERRKRRACADVLHCYSRRLGWWKQSVPLKADIRCGDRGSARAEQLTFTDRRQITAIADEVRNGEYQREMRRGAERGRSRVRRRLCATH
jgi:hypothetical protein